MSREEIRLCLMNTTFLEADIDKSDIGTWYLTNSGLQKILETMAECGVVIKKALPYTLHGDTPLTAYEPLIGDE